MAVAAEWTDLVDPSGDEIAQAITPPPPPAAMELLTAPAGDGRAAMPLLQGHGHCVLAVLVHPLTVSGEDRADYVELDIIATPHKVVTIRKTGANGELASVDSIAARVDAGVSVGRGRPRRGRRRSRRVPRARRRHLRVDRRPRGGDRAPDGRCRAPADLRPAQRAAAGAPRIQRDPGIARRIVDGRVDIGHSELFPPELELRFVDAYETLVRATEELDVARDLLGGVRDYYQAKIAEQQNEVAKTLTVIAALVLVPSLIVGFYGQNFAGHFGDWYWSLGISLGLIVATTVVQVVLFRRRRWL